MRLTLESLDTKHPHYQLYEQTWSEIEELYEGNELLTRNLPYYLPKRIGEIPELYQLRLEKFTYYNNLSKGVNTLINKLSTGSLRVENANTDFWADFRNNVDLTGREEKEYLLQIFRLAILYGQVFVHLDREKSDVEPQNLMQEEILDLDLYFTTYTARQVIDWEVDRAGNLTFCKIKQSYYYREDIFSDPVLRTVYTLVDKDVIAKYQVDSLDSRSESTAVTRQVIVNTNSDLIYYEPEVTNHGFGEMPIKILKFESELWLTNLVLKKTKEALRLENSIADALDNGLPINRVYKPYEEGGEVINFEKSDSEIRLGNAYVNKLESLQYVEIAGTGIVTGENKLANIKTEIESILTMKITSPTNSSSEASFASKKFDIKDLESGLVNYGSRLKRLYESLLIMIHKSFNMTGDLPKVSGLTTFELDDVSGMLLLAQGIKTTQEFIPNTALRSFAKRFSLLIINSDNKVLIEKVNDEIDSMDFDTLKILALDPNNSLGDPTQISKPKRSGNETEISREQTN